MVDDASGPPITVLSIDGGGIRGLIPALVLAELEERTGRPLHALFDLIAGTSTGGLLALGLTVPKARPGPPEARYTARELASLYVKEGPRIFRRSLWRRARTAAGLLEEKYADDGLETVLETYFGGTPLSAALTEVLVTAYALEEREAYFFKRHKARRAPDAHDVPMRTVGRATSAAPTYFEPARVRRTDGEALALVDGGVFAGNPAMCAYAEAVEHFDEQDTSPRVLVMSLGTGKHTQPIPYRHAKNWGTAGWARPILDVVFHGVSDTVDYQLNHVLPADDYYRFQVRLVHGDDAFDDTSAANLYALRRDARRLIDERTEALDALAERLAEKEGEK